MRWDIAFLFALLFNGCDISSTLSSGSLFWLMQFFLQTPSYLHCRVWNVWLQNYSKVKCLSSTHHGCYTGSNTTHFVYVSVPTLKWSVLQLEKCNHNIFFWPFSPPLCCTIAVKSQWLKFFSLTPIHPNFPASMCFSKFIYLNVI